MATHSNCDPIRPSYIFRFLLYGSKEDLINEQVVHTQSILMLIGLLAFLRGLLWAVVIKVLVNFKGLVKVFRVITILTFLGGFLYAGLKKIHRSWLLFFLIKISGNFIKT